MARGEFIDHDGSLHMVTRWTQGEHGAVEPRAGRCRQWEVWGRPVDPEYLAATVDQAAERILAEVSEPGQSSGEHTPGGR